MNRTVLKHGIIFLNITLFLLCAMMPVQAKEIVNCWDETRKAHYLRRKISSAINVYAKEGTTPRVKHETGVLAGVEYDVLRIDPDKDTFLQVDYSETPTYLNALVDESLLSDGYVRVGGINAGYFNNTTVDYGRPVGAVRTHNEWTTWHGQLNTPAYGSGYATAYFNTYDMEIRYHGWKNNRWQGDHIWSWWTGYLIDAENAVSGSYTYFVDGKEADITRGEVSGINYHRYGRALTILAQNAQKQFLLLEFYGTISDAYVLQFLRENQVTDAIRLDGGGSCQMVYDDELVNQEYEPGAMIPVDTPLFEKDVVKKRWADLLIDQKGWKKPETISLESAESVKQK